MGAFAWAEDAKERPKAEFGDRLRFVEIREATPEEWALLPDFTYEAIFKRPEDGFVPRTVLQHPALKGYYQGFGSGEADRCLVAVADGAVVGAVWTRAAAGYGSLDAETPELAMSLYPEWRGMGIGSRLLNAILRLAEGEGWGAYLPERAARQLRARHVP